MHALNLAFRNILRNKRRSMATISAVMISCGGLLLFAGYTTWVHWAAELHSVTQVGHIQIFRKGYYARGAGNPSSFAIDSYGKIKKLLLEDAVLKERLQLVTGQLLITGLASSFSNQTSTPFLGLGVFPSEHQQVIDWNPHHIYDPRLLKINRDLFEAGPELDTADEKGGTLGTGLAAILHIGMEPEATGRKNTKEGSISAGSALSGPDLSFMPLAEKKSGERPEVELLSIPPVGGTPNVVTLSVRRVVGRATKDVDDRLLKMPIALASSLMFPGEELKVTAILILLRRAEDVPLVNERLNHLFQEHGLDLESKTWLELIPDYERSIGMFDMFFKFTLCVVGVVLIFTIFNTIHMGVIERTGEIGTIRAIGMTKGGVMSGFLLEGLVMGCIGAGLGVLLGILVAAIINRVEIVYHPPIVPFYAKLEVLVLDNPPSILACFFGTLLVALIASVPAAKRAASMNIADALRD